MSIALNPLQTKSIVPVTTDLNVKRVFGVMGNSDQNTYVVLPSNNASTSQLIYNSPPPNANIVIDRHVQSVMPFNLQFTGTAGASGRLLDIGTYSAPRAYPQAQVLSTMSSTINNASVSMNTADVWNAFTRCGISPEEIKMGASLCPTMLDQFQNYSDMSGPTTGYGTALNPLGLYGNNTYQPPRGGFSGIEVISNPNVGAGNAATAEVNLTTTEYIYLSPFLFGDQMDVGLVNVNTLTFQFKFGNLSRLWSQSTDPNAGVISGINVTFNGMPSLLFNYITPAIPIPRSLVIPYHNVDAYPTEMQASVNPGADFSQPSANIQLNSIPSRMLIYLRQRNADLTYTSSDVYARINALTINWNNKNGLLAGASAQQLYKMSEANGLNMSWDAYNKYVGGPLIIEFGKDICLDVQKGEAPGLLLNGQLQVNITSATNLNTVNSIQYALYIVIISSGIITIVDNTSIQQNSVLTRQDVLNTFNTPNAAIEHHHKTFDYYGGKFSLSKALSGANRFLKDTKAISTAAKLAGHPAIATAARSYGYGLVSEYGGSRSGGAMARRGHMKHRLLRGSGVANKKNSKRDDDSDSDSDSNDSYDSDE
jgi:hypothetical protein